MQFSLIKFPSFVLIGTLMLSSCSSTEKQKEKDMTEIIQKTESFQLPDLPKSVSFCGEEFPLDNFDVRERLDKELIVNAYYHSSTIQGLKRANRYFPEIEKALKENGIPDDFKYLCLIESGLSQAVSPAGAKGFWQFMPATAEEFNLTVNNQNDERLDVTKSTNAACKYLRKAQNKFNNWMLTAASYNAGMGGIQNAMEDQLVERYFDLHLNNETSRYVFRILAMKIIFENPEAYGFSKEQIELYEPIATRKIEVKEVIPDLKKWVKENGSNYHMVKVLNPWILRDKLDVRNEVLTIELPK
jgi:membrane-bound lytic murein transglycosylase D